MGVEFKNNIKKAWWKKFIQENPYNVGIDAALLMNPRTWIASGHLDRFNDPLIDCRECKARFRADNMIEDYMSANNYQNSSVTGWDNEQMLEFINSNKITCPECGKHNFTSIRHFNLMFKTFQELPRIQSGIVPKAGKQLREYL